MYLIKTKKFRIEAGWFSGDPFYLLQIGIGQKEYDILTILHFQFLKFSICIYWDMTSK
jgi:hypothetical protein